MRESSKDTEQSGEVLLGGEVHCTNEVGGRPNEESSLASGKTSPFRELISVVNDDFIAVMWSNDVMDAVVSIATVVIDAREGLGKAGGEISTSMAVFSMRHISTGSGGVTLVEIRLGGSKMLALRGLLDLGLEVTGFLREFVPIGRLETEVGGGQVRSIRRGRGLVEPLSL